MFLGSIFEHKAKTSMLQKLAFSLGKTTNFKGSRLQKSNKKRSKIEPKLRPKNDKQKKVKKKGKRDENEREMSLKIEKKESEKKKEKREGQRGREDSGIESCSSALPV